MPNWMWLLLGIGIGAGIQDRLLHWWYGRKR